MEDNLLTIALVVTSVWIYLAGAISTIFHGSNLTFNWKDATKSERMIFITSLIIWPIPVTLSFSRIAFGAFMVFVKSIRSPIVIIKRRR